MMPTCKMNETKLEVAENYEEADLSDVEDDVFVRGGRNGYRAEYDTAKKPLMTPRKKSYANGFESMKNGGLHTEVRGTPPSLRVLCVPMCYILIATFAMLGLVGVITFLSNSVTLPLSVLNLWKKGPSLNGSQMFLPCDNIDVHDVWVRKFPKLLTESSFRLLDVNKDGVDDIIIGYATGADGYGIPDFVCDIYFPGQSPCFGGVLALNGLDGTELWRHWTAHEVFAVNCNEDISQDGVPDCLIGGRAGVFCAISGVDGSLLWTFQDGPAKNAIMNIYTSQFIKDMNGDGVQEILTVHGGDPLADPGSTNRLSGRIMIVSGKTGEVLQWVGTPDEKESYYSPQVLTLPDGTDYVFFGTGGETHGGGLYVLSLPDLYKGNVENARLLYKDDFKGIMVPPVIVDINSDGVEDIVMAMFNSTVVAFDGSTFQQIWNYTFPSSETYTTPTPGYFNEDKVPDFLVKYQYGPGFPIYYHAQTTVLDGASGKPILENPIIDTIGSQASTPVIRTEGIGNDIFLYWSSNCKGYEGNSSQFSFVKGTSVHEQSRADFCKLRFNSKLINQLRAFNRVTGLPGTVIYDSELRTSQEYANITDTSDEGQAYLRLHPEMWQYLDTSMKTSSLDASSPGDIMSNYHGAGLLPSGTGINMGLPIEGGQYVQNMYDLPSQPELTETIKYPSYHSVHKHGKYNNPLPLGSEITGGGDMSNGGNDLGINVNRRTQFQQQEDIKNRVDRERNERNNLWPNYYSPGGDVAANEPSYAKGERGRLRYLPQNGDMDPLQQNEDINLDGAQDPYKPETRWKRDSLKEQGKSFGRRKPRHIGPHDMDGIQRLISTGTLAKPLKDSDDGIDLVFATYWFFPAKTQAILPKDQECIQDKLSQEKDRFDERTMPHGIYHDVVYKEKGPDVPQRCDMDPCCTPNCMPRRIIGTSRVHRCCTAIPKFDHSDLQNENKIWQEDHGFIFYPDGDIAHPDARDRREDYSQINPPVVRKSGPYSERGRRSFGHGDSQTPAGGTKNINTNFPWTRKSQMQGTQTSPKDTPSTPTPNKEKEPEKPLKETQSTKSIQTPEADNANDADATSKTDGEETEDDDIPPVKPMPKLYQKYVSAQKVANNFSKKKEGSGKEKKKYKTLKDVETKSKKLKGYLAITHPGNKKESAKDNEDAVPVKKKYKTLKDVETKSKKLKGYLALTHPGNKDKSTKDNEDAVPVKKKYKNLKDVETKSKNLKSYLTITHPGKKEESDDVDKGIALIKDAVAGSKTDLQTASKTDLQAASKTDLQTASKTDLQTASKTDLQTASKTGINLKGETNTKNNDKTAPGQEYVVMPLLTKPKHFPIDQSLLDARPRPDVPGKKIMEEDKEQDNVNKIMMDSPTASKTKTVKGLKTKSKLQAFTRLAHHKIDNPPTKLDKSKWTDAENLEGYMKETESHQKQRRKKAQLSDPLLVKARGHGKSSLDVEGKKKHRKKSSSSKTSNKRSSKGSVFTLKALSHKLKSKRKEKSKRGKSREATNNEKIMYYPTRKELELYNEEDTIPAIDSISSSHKKKSHQKKKDSEVGKTKGGNDEDSIISAGIHSTSSSVKHRRKDARFGRIDESKNKDRKLTFGLSDEEYEILLRKKGIIPVPTAYREVKDTRPKIPDDVVKNDAFWGYKSTRYLNPNQNIRLPTLYGLELSTNEHAKAALVQDETDSATVIPLSAFQQTHQIPDPYNTIPLPSVKGGPQPQEIRLKEEDGKDDKKALKLPVIATKYTPEPTGGLRAIYSADMAKLTSINQSQVQQLKTDSLVHRAAKIEQEIYQDDLRPPHYRFIKKYKEIAHEDERIERANWVPCDTCFNSKREARDFNLGQRLDNLEKAEMLRKERRKAYLKAHGNNTGAWERILGKFCGSRYQDNASDASSAEIDDTDLEHFMDAPYYKEKRKSY